MKHKKCGLFSVRTVYGSSDVSPVAGFQHVGHRGEVGPGRKGRAPDVTSTFCLPPGIGWCEKTILSFKNNQRMTLEENP